jgi:hypothetical protein
MSNRYQKTLETIKTGKMSRAELTKLMANAQSKVGAGDRDALAVLEALNSAIPADEEYVFMGFCPGANFDNRLDIEWKKNGILTFVFWESEQQRDRFVAIAAGDLVILKKRHQYGKTMQLFGFGRVLRRRVADDGKSYLEMDWSKQERIIEVPLLACNSTIDVRSAEKVIASMPPDFFEWLNEPGDAVNRKQK